MLADLNDIPWDKPILPVVADPEFEAQVKRQMGGVPDYVRRVSPSPWLRRSGIDWRIYRYTHLPTRLVDISFLVTSQENSCRYCYGAARAQLRLLGYSEQLIDRIERDTQLAEMDEKERVFIRFCRNLARSKPRPGRAMREELLTLGFSPLAVSEMAFLIAGHCFGNRICTLLACRPEAQLESLSESWLGWVMRPLIRRQLRKTAPHPKDEGPPDAAALSPVAATLQGLPAAHVVQQAITGAFASPVIPAVTKGLMFAVIARALGCVPCEKEMCGRLELEGLSPAKFENSLSTLTPPAPDPRAEALLIWARATVHYQNEEIQRHTRQLLAQVGPAQTLEAVGVAALANATVRLATLLA